MKSVNDFVGSLFADAPITTNQHGNEIRRAFLPSERYRIDFAEEFKAEGWEQFDTDQDAAYFGVWVNRSRLQTLTYAEGDWTLVTCPDWDHYAAEVGSAIEFYGEGFIAKVLDDRGTKTTYCQDRSRFLLPS